MKFNALFLPVAAWVLSACASSPAHGAAASRRLASVDCEFYFSSTGLPNIHTIEYTITRDARIQQVDDDWERTWFRKRTKTRRLTGDGWQEFQKTLARLDLYRWKPVYSPRQNIDDGYGWNLRLSVAARTFKSRGANAGPSPSNPKNTVTILDHGKTSADVILARALHDLWEKSAR